MALLSNGKDQGKLPLITLPGPLSTDCVSCTYVHKSHQYLGPNTRHYSIVHKAANDYVLQQCCWAVSLPCVSCSKPMLCPIICAMVEASFSWLDSRDCTDITDKALSVHIESGIESPDEPSSNSIPLQNTIKSLLTWLMIMCFPVLSAHIPTLNCLWSLNTQLVKQF